MDIAACTDKRFIMPTGVMMFSVCKNNPDVDVIFHIIIDDDVTSKDKRELEETIREFRNTTVCFYDANYAVLSSFPDSGIRYDITQACYYRLMLAEILPDRINKLLYFDGDIIVRGSLRPVWDIDLTGFAIAAAADCVETRIDLYNRLRYPSEKGYFNSGVLLINLEYWRNHKVTNEFNDFINNRTEDIIYHDQDVLNGVFWDRKLSFPIRYNFMGGYLWKSRSFDYGKYEKEFLEACKNPVVVHFTGEKPWSAYQRTPHPFSSTWFLYQNQTQWRGIKSDNRPLKLRLVNFSADTLRKLRVIPRDTRYDYIEIKAVD